MSKYFLTGGLAGPWKKSKVDNLKPVYIPATVTEDSDTHQISISTDITYDDLVDLYDKNKNLVIEADLEFAESSLYIPLIARGKSVFVFGVVVDFSGVAGDNPNPQFIYVIIDDEDHIGLRFDNLALAQE